jgi:hypothetical protein
LLHCLPLPLPLLQVLHLIRHAEGFHNAAAHRDGTGYVSWDYEDAQLTAKGWKQVSLFTITHQHPAPIVPKSSIFVILCTVDLHAVEAGQCASLHRA